VIHEFNRLASTSHASTPPLDTPLTPREHEILHLLAYGHTNAEIAQRLYITEGTVKNHVTGILSKLGVADRAQAVQRAKALRLT
jgi:DNA-binding NarL/FixJ family response regulator